MAVNASGALTAPSAPPARMRSRRSGPIVLVLASCGTAVSLMQTLVVPLLPRLLDTTADNAAWLLGHTADQRRRDADLVAPR